jgi:hypothetical protein
MAFCETRKTWTINLLLDNSSGPPERLALDLEITDGNITGVVRVSNGERMSQITGRCEPQTLSDLPPVSFMSLTFRVRKGGVAWGVHLSGYARPPLNNPRFAGKFRTFTPDINTPPSEGTGELQVMELSTDPGDTGTGTGQQT